MLANRRVLLANRKSAHPDRESMCTERESMHADCDARNPDCKFTVHVNSRLTVQAYPNALGSDERLTEQAAAMYAHNDGPWTGAISNAERAVGSSFEQNPTCMCKPTQDTGKDSVPPERPPPEHPPQEYRGRPLFIP